MKARIRIESDRCKGCGLCIHFCPKGEILISKSRNKRGNAVVVFKDTGVCSGCRSCALMCPDAAIEVIVDGKG